MAIVSINQSFNSSTIIQSLSLQVVRDYVNRRWYFTSVARVAFQHHISINLDFSHLIVNRYNHLSNTTRDQYSVISDTSINSWLKINQI